MIVQGHAIPTPGATHSRPTRPTPHKKPKTLGEVHDEQAPSGPMDIAHPTRSKHHEKSSHNRPKKPEMRPAGRNEVELTPMSDPSEMPSGIRIADMTEADRRAARNAWAESIARVRANPTPAATRKVADLRAKAAKPAPGGTVYMVERENRWLALCAECRR